MMQRRFDHVARPIQLINPSNQPSIARPGPKLVWSLRCCASAVCRRRCEIAALPCRFRPPHQVKTLPMPSKMILHRRFSWNVTEARPHEKW